MNKALCGIHELSVRLAKSFLGFKMTLAEHGSLGPVVRSIQYHYSKGPDQQGTPTCLNFTEVPSFSVLVTNSAQTPCRKAFGAKGFMQVWAKVAKMAEIAWQHSWAHFGSNFLET